MSASNECDERFPHLAVESPLDYCSDENMYMKVAMNLTFGCLEMEESHKQMAIVEDNMGFHSNHASHDI